MTSPHNSPDDAQPTARPDLFGRPARKVSRAPVTRLTGKNALNPTVVTIFGAGISGLTAAHELVERGCRVYVVEAETDPEWPGQCLIGGMAASQYGRVRAGVEALHPDLLDSANSPSPEIDAWLLELFLMNRTDWIQTNPPVILPAVRFLPDQGNSRPIGSRPLTYSYYSGAAGPPELAKVVRDLKAQRRRQWIWDLVWRNYYTGHAATQEERGPINVLPNLKQDRKDMEDVCSDLYARLIDDRLLQEVTGESADELLQSQNPLTRELGGWKH